MKKNLFIIFGMILICVGIWFMFNSHKTEDAEKILENVTMVIKEGTLTKKGATIIITDVGKDINTFGSTFKIEKKENGKWKSLKTIVKNYGFTAEGYHVDENHKLEMEVKWDGLYGELQKGEYRLVKDADITRNDSYVGVGYVYTEFIIE